VLAHLFQTKRLVFANFFVLLCPRNHAFARVGWHRALDSTLEESNLSGHNRDSND
jgi:hypothetical protein